MLGSNQRRLSRRFYRALPNIATNTHLPGETLSCSQPPHALNHPSTESRPVQLCPAGTVTRFVSVVRCGSRGGTGPTQSPSMTEPFGLLEHPPAPVAGPQALPPAGGSADGDFEPGVCFSGLEGNLEPELFVMLLSRRPQSRMTPHRSPRPLMRARMSSSLRRRRVADLAAVADEGRCRCRRWAGTRSAAQRSGRVRPGRPP